MLRYSTQFLILCSLLLVPASAEAQEKAKDIPAEKVKAENIIVEVEEDVIVEKVVEEATEKNGGKKTVKVIAGKDLKKPVELKIDADGKHEIRLIEINGEDMPAQLNVIMKRLSAMNGKPADGKGKPQVMSFTIDADGDLEELAGSLDKSIQEALQSIEVTVDGDETEKSVIRVLQNAGPGLAELKELKSQSIDLQNLTDKLADIKGTISITTSSSSSSQSSDGKKPTVVTNSQIRIIGPDGKVQEMKFNGTPLNEDAIEKAVEEALKKAGRDVPADVQKRVEEALKRARERSVNVFGNVGSMQNSGPDAAKAALKKAQEDHQQRMVEHNKRIAEMTKRTSQPPGKSIEKKLDLILKRLEKMQKEIDELKQK